jgi:hypothetical protein
MNLDHLHRDLGRVEGEVLALRRDVDAMNAKLDTALAHINRARGISYALGAGTSAAVAFFTAWFVK